MKKIIYILILISLISLVNAGKVNYTTSLSCNSHSMSPTIECEDKLTVNTVTKNDNITIGDIYCYRPDYRFFNLPAYWSVCHRLIDIKDDLYYFKGDNNEFNDMPVQRKYINWEIVKIQK